MKNITYIFSFVLIILLTSCSEENQPVVIGKDPSIVKVNIMSNWSIYRDKTYSVEIEVTDPQGPGTLALAMFTVQNEAQTVVFKDTLYDDGAFIHKDDGDVLAKDGIFRNQFLAAQIDSVSGIYSFTFNVTDEDENEAVPQTTEVVFGLNVAPLLVEVLAPDSLKSGADADYVYATVSDINGNDEITKVHMGLYKPGSSNAIASFLLFNDGNAEENGDIVAGDSIYSYKMDSSFAAGKNGIYNLEFIAEDTFEDQSVMLLKTILLENEVGKILNITMPDSVVRPAQIPIYATVTDPQGLTDIDSVYFLLEQEDGTFIKNQDGSLLKLLLFDDGDYNGNGDALEGDGVFSEILSVTTQNIAETYIFHFYMRDRVGNLSTVQKHPLKIK